MITNVLPRFFYQSQCIYYALTVHLAFGYHISTVSQKRPTFGLL